MAFELLVQLANELDSAGLYQEAQIVDDYLYREAQAQRKPRRKKRRMSPIARLLRSPVVRMAVTTALVASIYRAFPTLNEDSGIIPPKMTVEYIPPLPTGEFDDFVDFLSDVEGGVSNRSKSEDPGGLTNLGITQDVYDDYRKSKSLKEQSVVKITEEEKNEIAKSQYWDVVRGDEIPREIAMALADWRFHGGPAIARLQQHLKIPVTKVMDDETMHALERYIKRNPDKAKYLAQKILSLRQKYLESLKTKIKGRSIPLINKNPGWYNRLNDLKSKINEDPAEEEQLVESNNVQ